MAFALRADRSSSLPSPRTPLVGREREVRALRELLVRPEVAIVTLTGAGGVGKTRLALAVAAAAVEDFPDGAVFVGLAALTDPALVLPGIAQMLGVHDTGDGPLADRLGDVIGERRLLLVLDNLEQVSDAATELARLLAACPRLTILATSRAVLRLSGEQVFPVLPLPVPEAMQPLALAELARQGAVALFVQRAQAADPEFALTPAHAPTIVEIVRRLDGLPLAIELAAARVRSLSAPALLARLSDRLRLLTGGARDLPDRQRTMRDTIAWSYDLLPPHEQELFRQLGVFVGGFTLAGAEAVAGEDVLDGITSLIDKSLLGKRDGPGEPRYAMLETVREYAREQLVASGNLDRTCRAHAAWCLALAEDIAPGLVRSAPVDAFERMPVEHDNLRAALGWAIERGEVDVALGLAASLTRFWIGYGYLSEGRRWVERALALPNDAPPALRARALASLSWLIARHGEPEAARPLAEEGLGIARACGDAVAEGRALAALGFIAIEAGDLDQAQARLERLLEITRALGDRRWEQTILSELGTLASLKGDLAGAAALYESALPLARTTGDRGLICMLTVNLALVLLRRGEIRRAAALQREALTHARDLSLTDFLAVALADAAEAAAASGRAEAATRLLGAQAALRVAADVPAPHFGQADDERLLASLRAALDEAAFAAAWAAGASLPLEAAVAEADALLSLIADTEEQVQPAAPAAPSGLTPREQDVLRLLVEGHSDREIADALGIAYRTVTSYVRNILAKFGVDSRTAAATHAVRLGIV